MPNQSNCIAYCVQYNTNIECMNLHILPTKITAALNDVAFSYHHVRGLYFLEVNFAVTIGNMHLITAYHVVILATILFVFVYLVFAVTQKTSIVLKILNETLRNPRTKI